MKSSHSGKTHKKMKINDSFHLVAQMVTHLPAMQETWV